jgi:hypothetical protein
MRKTEAATGPVGVVTTREEAVLIADASTAAAAAAADSPAGHTDTGGEAATETISSSFCSGAAYLSYHL